MFGSITAATATFTLDHLKNATHTELRLFVRSCMVPSNIVVISPTVFTPLQSKDKRKGVHVPKNADVTLSLPLLCDLDAYELCVSVLLAEVVKDNSTTCIELTHVFSRSAFAEIIAGRTIEETIPLSNSTATSCTDHLRLSLSYRKPLRKANSATYECIRLDTLLIQLIDIKLPLSKRSYLDDQPLCFRICTQTYASEFPLVEIHSEHSNKNSSQDSGKRLYQLASPIPIYIPYSPVITLQIVFLYNVVISQSFFELNGLRVGTPSTNVRRFCDCVPIFQCSIDGKKIVYSHQSFGIPLSFSFPSNLISSDLVSFYDVICTTIQLAVDSVDKSKKTPRSSLNLLENLKEAVIPHIFEGIFLRGGDIADIFSPYRSTLSITGQSKSDSARFKAYEKILQFAGLTDTLLAVVGKSWTDLATGSDPLQKLTQNKIHFVATFLLDIFDPYSSSAAKRNNATYPDSTLVSTPKSSSERQSAIQRFESLNCAARVRDMIYVTPSKRQNKDTLTSCITILPMEFSLTNTLISNKICIYTIRFHDDSINNTDDKISFSDFVPIVVSGPELARNNRALWHFVLEERKDAQQTIAAGPIINATQSEKSIDCVLLGCKDNSELSYADYYWILPQVLFLPEGISSQQTVRDRVAAFEKSTITVCLHDFETDTLLARGKLRLKNVTNTFIAAATSNLDVEIKLRWFYEKEFLQFADSTENTVTFLASCYGFLKELQPTDSPPQVNNNSANVSICGNSTTGQTTAPADHPLASSIHVEAAKTSDYLMSYENIPACPGDLSTIEHAKAHRDEKADHDDRELRTPRLLSGKDIEIVDGTITFQFGNSQRKSVSGAVRGISENPEDELNVLKQLVHTLRKDLERVTPKSFKQAVAASPSTYAGLEHSVSEDLRQKIGVYTGVTMNNGNTTYDICQTVAEKLDRNILAYLLVDMAKQNIQLTKELDGARDKIDILEHTCTSNDVALSKLKALVLEQEQLLQYMEARSKKIEYKPSGYAEKLAAIEKENARLTELLRAITASLNKGGVGKSISATSSHVVHSRAHSSPLSDDGRNGVLLSVKLPPGRLPPLSPDSKALSS